ncbi:MAG: hypothetical protein Q9165_006991 [Trypethelium subeluteriae]
MTEDEELKAKIAMLSGRIKMHKQTARYPNSAEHPQIRGGGSQWVPQRGTPYGIPRPRAGRYQASHRNRTLVLNNPGSAPIPSIAEPASDQIEPNSQGGDASGWVTKRDRHNQLINTAVFEQKNQERMQAMKETAEKKQIERNARQQEKVMKHFAAEQAPTKSAVLNHEVDVDNIRFRVSSDGSKLVRIDGNPKTARSTPKQTRIGGVLFLRSKNGNLYRSGLVKKKKKTTATQAEGEEEAISDFSSDEEYDQIDSDDVDSDDLEDQVIMTGLDDEQDHELSQQQDFVRF